MFEGKKVFFILPHEIVREHIVSILSENEYEVYIINDQRKLDTLVQRYPDSILYINIDGTLTEIEWKRYIKSLKDQVPDLQVGILSGRITDQDVVNSYIMDLGVNCGFIQLRQGVKDCANHMLKVLEANEAKGRRKYLRYSCIHNDQITLNFSYMAQQYLGSILDVSSVGLSCRFEDDPLLSRNELIPDVQLRLGGILLTTDCVNIGSRDDHGTQIYVFLFRFAPARIAQRSKIRNFIHKSLQKDLDNELS
ncbi:MAG: PilZ domain-containing protein [Spirochaetales bacterium]|nr:PilZ domain-containing protein [Spirochaetales bacterium]